MLVVPVAEVEAAVVVMVVNVIFVMMGFADLNTI